MSYYLYKEDRVLGPYSFFEIERAGSVSGDTLVCEESKGQPDGNWRSVQDVVGGATEIPVAIESHEIPADISEDSLSDELSWVMPFLSAGKKPTISFPLIDRYLSRATHWSPESPAHLGFPSDLMSLIPPARSAGVVSESSFFEEAILKQIQSLEKRFDEFHHLQEKSLLPVTTYSFVNPLPPISPIITELPKQIHDFAPPAAPPVPPAFPVIAENPEPIRAVTPPVAPPVPPAPPAIMESPIQIRDFTPPILSPAVPFAPVRTDAPVLPEPSIENLEATSSVSDGLHLKLGDSFTVVSESEGALESASSEEGGGLHLKLGDSFDALPEKEEVSLPLEAAESPADSSTTESQGVVSPDDSGVPSDNKSEMGHSSFFENISNPSAAQPSATEPAQSPFSSEFSAGASSPEASSSPFGEIIIQSSLQAAESNAGSMMEPVITPLFEPSLRQVPPPEGDAPAFSEMISSPQVAIGGLEPFQPASGSQDLIERFSKASPDASAQSQTKKVGKKSRSKLMPVLGIGVVFLVGVFFFLFFRNPKDLGTMLSAGADQKPLGLDVAPSSGNTSQQGGAPIASPANGGEAPALNPAQNQAQSPLPVAGTVGVAPMTVSSQTDQATPVVSPPHQAESNPPIKKPSRGDRAIEFVKDYPLEGDKGSVGKWLDYAFAADPGENSRQEWTFGKLDQNSYLVRYRLIRGDASNNQKDIVYLFEADVEGGMVKGDNPPARALLSGEAPKVGRKTHKKKSIHRK